jgi:YD repeat-containing protein
MGEETMNAIQTLARRQPRAAGSLTSIRLLPTCRALMASLLGLAGNSAPAQNYNAECKDRSPTGQYECTVMPHVIGPWLYQVPGSYQSTPWTTTEPEAIDLQKGYIAVRLGASLCSQIKHSDPLPFSVWPYPTDYDYKRLINNQRYPIEFSYLKRVSKTECVPEKLFDYVYRRREVRCASGWTAANDSSLSAYCRRLAEESVLSCPAGNGPDWDSALVGNPIHAGSNAKYQTALDYTAYGSPLRFERIYSSIGFFQPPGISTEQNRYQMGPFWRHTWYRRLTVQTTSPTSSTIRSVVLERGHQIAGFFPGASDGYRQVFVPRPEQNDNLAAELINGLPAVWLYTAEDNSIERYEAGLLVSVQYADGSAVSVTHGPFGPQQVMDNTGRVLQMHYDEWGRLNELTLPDAQKVSYSYLASIHDYSVYLNIALPPTASYTPLERVTYPDGRQMRYHYNEPEFSSGIHAQHLLTGVTDERGARLATYRYVDGRATSTEHAGGVQRWQLDPNSATVVHPLGSKLSFSFSPIGGRYRETYRYTMTASVQTIGSLSKDYDVRGNRTQVSNELNQNICTAYDNTRNLPTRQLDGVGSVYCPSALTAPPAGARVLNWQWHPDWSLPTQQAEPRRLTRWVYNGQGGAGCAPVEARLDGKPLPLVCERTEQTTADDTGAQGFAATAVGTASRWTYTYDRHGRVLTADGPQDGPADRTVYSYYPDTTADWTAGDLQSVTTGQGLVTRFTRYDRHGNPLEMLDAAGRRHLLTYDLRQRLVRHQMGAQVTAHTYDPAGLLLQTDLPDGSTLRYTYDAAQRLTGAEDSRGQRLAYTLDAAGNPTLAQSRDPQGQLARQVEQVFDTLGRLQRRSGQ